MGFERWKVPHFDLRSRGEAVVLSKKVREERMRVCESWAG